MISKILIGYFVLRICSKNVSIYFPEYTEHFCLNFETNGIEWFNHVKYGSYMILEGYENETGWLPTEYSQNTVVGFWVSESRECKDHLTINYHQQNNLAKILIIYLYSVDRNYLIESYYLHMTGHYYPGIYEIKGDTRGMTINIRVNNTFITQTKMNKSYQIESLNILNTPMNSQVNTPLKLSESKLCIYTARNVHQLILPIGNFTISERAFMLFSIRFVLIVSGDLSKKPFTKNYPARKCEDQSTSNYSLFPTPITIRFDDLTTQEIDIKLRTSDGDVLDLLSYIKSKRRNSWRRRFSIFDGDEIILEPFISESYYEEPEDFDILRYSSEISRYSNRGQIFEIKNFEHRNLNFPAAGYVYAKIPFTNYEYRKLLISN
ncbi:hypothetical protein HZS_7813, partial [Henneguya salminicola]